MIGDGIVSTVILTADVILAVGVVILLWVINKHLKTRPPAVDATALEELRRLIAESTESADRFSSGILEARKSLKEVVCLLEERERALRELLGQGETLQGSNEQRSHLGERDREKRYGEVRIMLDRGMPVAEAARLAGLPEGEVRLIADLERQRNE
ncbi:MAG: hypothetical protein JW884_07085 [Deltaproteobacteria bacterium]|nr:hypothetical protein [Deltaproteobacteria bacterium]